MRLSSMSFLEGFYYKPRIDKEILERHSEGLICLSGCASAEFSDHVLHGKTAEAEKLCAWYQKVFGEENFYVEIQDNGIADPARLHGAGAIDLARRMGLPRGGHQRRPLPDARRRRRRHDILLCINTGKTVDDPNRMRFENDQFHVRSPEEMYAAMPGHEEALADVGADRRDGRGALQEPEPRQAPVPLVPAARREDARGLPRASSAKRGCASATATRRRQEARDRLEHELGDHQPDGVRVVLPDRLGLRPVRPRGGHPQLGERIGVRGAGQLRALPQPRRPAQVRPPVRAVPRPEPLGGA